MTKRAKQGFLAGQEPPSILAVDAAADDYFDQMNKRCRLSKKEAEAQANLLERMIEHGLERYVTPDGLVCTRTSKSKIKVKKQNDPESNGESDE